MTLTLYQGTAMDRASRSYATATSRRSTVFTALFSAGSPFKSYLSSRSFRVKCDNLSSVHTSSCGVPQLKVLLSALYSSSCTIPLSVLLSLPFPPSTTTFMQLILSSSSLSTHSTVTQAFLTFKTLFNTSLPG